MITIDQVVTPAWVERMPESQVLIAMLYIRGVTIKEIFAKYYEYDAHADARALKLEDAELAGLAELPTEPKERQPF